LLSLRLYADDMSQYEEFFYKEYSSNIISGAREKFEFENEEYKKSFEISFIKVDVNLFNNYSRITINYIIRNKSKNEIKCNFLYPFIYSNVFKKIEKSEKGKLIENRTENVEKKSLYKDFKIIENGIKRDYEIKFSNIEESNIPYSIGNERKLFNDTTLFSEKVISFIHKYGFFSIDLKFKSKERKILTVIYNVDHYNNNIKTNFEYSNSMEDPALRYMFKKVDDTIQLLSDYIFYFILKPQYSEQVIIPKKVFIKLRPYLINNNHLKILPSKYKWKGSDIIFSYSNPKFKDYDNIYISILPLNSKNSIPSFYFKSSLEKIKRDKGEFFLLKKNEDLIFEYIEDNNLSFLYQKDNNKIGITEIRILPKIFTLKKSIKDTNLPLEFEISFSDNKDFKDATTITKKFSYKEFYTLLNKKRYLTLFKGERIFCKFIKLRVIRTFFKEDEIQNENNDIQINDIEFIN